MTIDITTPCETDSLLRPLQGTFYACRIPEQHNQLKNHISTKDPNIVYYAAQNEIFALNIVTRKRRLVKSLPFKPCCLDAAYGWICAGGEDNGQCAFISIDEGEFVGEGSLQHGEVDELLPLDLDPEYRRSFHTPRRSQHWAHPPSVSFPKYDLQTVEFGGSIVNSVTIYQLRSDQQGFNDEIVTVITNNDEKVRIFSMTQCCTLETLSFPIPMNHASISPDGKLLLAVGDQARAFFCRRVQLPNATAKEEHHYAKYRWIEAAKPVLSLADQESDACFTTAFSPSGHICAAASQSGIITVFDTSLIENDMDTDQAVIGVLRSSRAAVPPTWVGAIRSMSFSPAPWDLLAWAEDKGRACVLDLRNAFRSRQTIELKTTSSDLHKAEVEEQDFTSEQRQLEIEHRFIERHREALEAQDQLAAVTGTADYLESTAERRRIDWEALDALSRSSPPSSTENERQMIDSIGLRRQPGNNAVHSDLNTMGALSDNHSQDWSGLPSPNSSSNSQNRSPASIHEFMRQRNWERSRSNENTYQPRRRSSVVISNSNSNANNDSSQQSASLVPIGPGAPTLSTSPLRIPSSAPDSNVPQIDPSDPWQTISDAMGASNMPPDTIARLRSLQSRNLERRMQATGTTPTSTSRRTHTSQRAGEQTMTTNAHAYDVRVHRAREANARALRQTRAIRADVPDELDREVLLRNAEEPRRRRVREDEGPTTMGIGWSEEGRHLFIATEDGILQYPVNIDGRKRFPGVSFL